MKESSAPLWDDDIETDQVQYPTASSSNNTMIMDDFPLEYSSSALQESSSFANSRSRPVAEVAKSNTTTVNDNSTIQNWKEDMEILSELIPQTYFCPLCTDLVENNIECPQCHHLFCYNCFIQWIRTQETKLKRDEFYCPTCRYIFKKPESLHSTTAIDSDSEDDTSWQQVLKHNVALQRLVNDVQVRCRLCFSKMEFSNFKKHILENCPEKTVSCDCFALGCHWLGKRKLYSHHKNFECTFFAQQTLLETIRRKEEEIADLKKDIRSKEEVIKFQDKQLQENAYSSQQNHMGLIDSMERSHRRVENLQMLLEMQHQMMLLQQTKYMITACESTSDNQNCVSVWKPHELKSPLYSLSNCKQMNSCCLFTKHNFDSLYSKSQYDSLQHFFIGASGTNLTIWNLKTNQALSSVTNLHQMKITTCDTIPMYQKDFSINSMFQFSNYLITGSVDKMIKVWDIEKVVSDSLSIQLVAQYNANAAVDTLCCTATHFYASTSNGTILIYDLQRPSNSSTVMTRTISKQENASVQLHTDSITSLKFDPINRLVWSGSVDKECFGWDFRIQHKYPIYRITHNSPVLSIVCNQQLDANVLYTGAADGKIRKFDLRRGISTTNGVDATRSIQCLEEFDNESAVYGLEYYSTNQLISLGADGYVKIWNTNPQKGIINTLWSLVSKNVNKEKSVASGVGMNTSQRRFLLFG